MMNSGFVFGACAYAPDPADTTDATFQPGLGRVILPGVIQLDCYSSVLVPDGPCCVFFEPGPWPEYASNVCGFLTVPCDAVAANVVRWMLQNGVSDAPQRLGFSVVGASSASLWFVPQPGVEGPPNVFHPFPLTPAGGAAHPGNVDALLGHFRAWPLSMRAFLWRASFGGVASRDTALPTRGELFDMNPALIVDALQGWETELRVLKMLLVALLSDHHIGGSIGVMFFRWCFGLDAAVSEAILKDRVST